MALQSNKYCWHAVLLAGAAVLAASLVINYTILPAYMPGLNAEYANTALFKPASDPAMYYLFLSPFVMVATYGLVYYFFREAMQYADNKDLKFGFVMWIAGSIPGLLMTLATMNVSPVMIGAWMLSGFIMSMIGAIVMIRYWDKCRNCSTHPL